MIRIDFFHPKLQDAVEAEAPSEMRYPRKSFLRSPIAVVFALTLLVVVVAVFIYSRRGGQEPSVQAPPAVKVPPQEVTKKPKREFVRGIPEEVVRETAPAEETPEKIPAPPPDFRYTVQVAAWEDVGDARRMADSFIESGFDARVETADIPGRGLYHRVRVGYFTDYDQAQAVGERLRSRFGCNIWIVSLE